MDIIPLKVIASVFKRHQLQENENSMAINRNEIESILSDIYFVIQKGYNFEIRRTLFYQSVTELLLSIYDK